MNASVVLEILKDWGVIEGGQYSCGENLLNKAVQEIVGVQCASNKALVARVNELEEGMMFWKKRAEDK